MALKIISLLTRFLMGWLFASSGYQKLQNLDQVIAYFSSLQIPWPHLQAPLVAGVELVAGTALILGLFPKLASLPLMIIMTVAMVTAKREDITGLSSLLETTEFLYFLLLAWIVASPVQCFGLSSFINKFRKNPTCHCGNGQC